MAREFIFGDIRNLALLLYVGLCSAYLTSVTSFSPFYFGLLFSLVFCFVAFLHRLSVFADKNKRALLKVFFITMIFYFVNLSYTKTFSKAVGLFFLLAINQFSTIYVYGICHYVKKEKIIKHCVRFYFYVTVVIGVIDLIYRWFIRLNIYRGPQYFYNFKMSIMFTDSNWNGFIYMLAFSFFIYLRDRYKMVSKNKLLVLFLFVLLAISRAAISCSVLVIIYSKFQKLSRYKKSIFVITVAIAFCCIFPILFYYAMHDDSFQTKLIIFKGLAYYLTHNSFTQLLIGFGTQFATSDLADMYMNYSGVVGHAYIVLKIMDLGIIGLFLELIYFYVLLKITNYSFAYLLIPFLVCGLSMCPSNLSFFYVFAGIIVFLESNRNKGEVNGFNKRDNADLQCRAVCRRGN